MTKVDIDGADDGLDVGFLVRSIIVGLTVWSRDVNPLIDSSKKIIDDFKVTAFVL